MLNPLLLNPPEQIETDRLVIRSPRPGDGPIMQASVRASLGALREFPASLPWALNEPTDEACEYFCREAHANYLLKNFMPMMVFLKDGQAHVGNSGLFAIDWTVPKCEIGFWVHSGHARRGYMTEAVRGITEFAFEHLGMRRIVALPDEGNGPSCQLCERAGYTLEATMRHERIAPNGILRNTRLYSMVR